eukprot:5271636-Pyramimonas_sp.AAC.1
MEAGAAAPCIAIAIDVSATTMSSEQQDLRGPSCIAHSRRWEMLSGLPKSSLPYIRTCKYICTEDRTQKRIAQGQSAGAAGGLPLWAACAQAV